MAFVTGLWLLDAPGSALNNRGLVGGQTDNVVEVKKAAAVDGFYPYVSAQAMRYWLRTTLEHSPDILWNASPILREAKVVYTDANPVTYDDDDLFGYMRAQGKSQTARQSRQQAAELPTGVEGEVTRISPLRVSPVMALAPTRVTLDYGTASRHEGAAVPYEHEFYRAVLRGLVSIDLCSAGTFTYTARSGFRNLDPIRVEQAKTQGLEHLPEKNAYRLAAKERVRRVTSLLQGFARLMGGAKLATHYTDVTPVALVAAVIKGGNNPFQYVVRASGREPLQGQPQALRQAVEVWGDQFLSPVYFGWTAGFHDEVGAELAGELLSAPVPSGVVKGHPREVLMTLCADLAANPGWLN